MAQPEPTHVDVIRGWATGLSHLAEDQTAFMHSLKGFDRSDDRMRAKLFVDFVRGLADEINTEADRLAETGQTRDANWWKTRAVIGASVVTAARGILGIYSDVAGEHEAQQVETQIEQVAEYQNTEIANMIVVIQRQDATAKPESVNVGSTVEAEATTTAEEPNTPSSTTAGRVTMELEPDDATELGGVRFENQTREIIRLTRVAVTTYPVETSPDDETVVLDAQHETDSIRNLRGVQVSNTTSESRWVTVGRESSLSD